MIAVKCESGWRCFTQWNIGVEKGRYGKREKYDIIRFKILLVFLHSGRFMSVVWGAEGSTRGY